MLIEEAQATGCPNASECRKDEPFGGCVLRLKTCLALVVALLLIPSAPAFAQQTAPPGPVEEPSTEPRFNFVPAYAYLHDYGWSEHLFYGWVGTLSMHVSKSLSIVGEFG